jgi:uncharacterized peroxidase-related enzyme
MHRPHSSILQALYLAHLCIIPKQNNFIMTRLTPLRPDNTIGKAKELLEAVKSKMGRVPNIAGAMAHSPALLQGYLGLSGALASGNLDPKLQEFIALAVAERNGCAYCLSAHTTIGNKVKGIDEATLLKSRTEESIDPRTDAALQFVRAIVDKKGKVSNADIAAVKDAGYTDEDIAEISGNVALNILTNYFNELAGTEIDFPIQVQPLKETV